MEEKQKFGGFWTRQKVEIFKKYLKAYLDIMKNQNFSLIYFDGFAGSGECETQDGTYESVGLQVIQFEHEKKFDIYYLVEQDENYCNILKERISIFKKNESSTRKIYSVKEDGNNKLRDLCTYLQKNQYTRALAFIDPYGLQVNWETLLACKGLGIDLWILIPTGAANRLLTITGEIEESWYGKLESFLGLSRAEIREHFYNTSVYTTLFGDESAVHKKVNAIEKLNTLYRTKLKEIWKHVSEAFPLRNNQNTTLFHFVLASNNPSALKIANDIIQKELSS
jgi:three-Cys-motif partner protein